MSAKPAPALALTDPAFTVILLAFSLVAAVGSLLLTVA